MFFDDFRGYRKKNGGMKWVKQFLIFVKLGYVFNNKAKVRTSKTEVIKKQNTPTFP